jgi:hypothetical protein
VAIAFGNDPAILGAVTAIIFTQIIVAAPIGTWMGRNQAEPLAEVQEASGEATGSQSEMTEGTPNG